MRESHTHGAIIHLISQGSHLVSSFHAHCSFSTLIINFSSAQHSGTTKQNHKHATVGPAHVLRKHQSTISSQVLFCLHCGASPLVFFAGQLASKSNQSVSHKVCPPVNVYHHRHLAMVRFSPFFLLYYRCFSSRRGKAKPHLLSGEKSTWRGT